MATAIRYLPSLSPDGWVSSPQKKFDYLLSHFLVAEYSQSYIFAGQVSSLTYLVQLYQGDVEGFCNALQTTLIRYLNSQFNNVVADITQVDVAAQSKAAVRMFITVDDDQGNTLNASYMIKTSGSVISEILKLMNTE